MKKSVFYITLCLFTLSSAYCRAERRTVVQNFHEMINAKPPTMSLKNSLKTGETDFVTYTCSSGAKFYYDATKTSNIFAIFLESAGSQVTTTKIQNLDSIRIVYMPADAKKDMVVEISTDSITWTEKETALVFAGLRTVKMPHANDYYVRIRRKGSNNVYIREMQYIYIDLSECPNCFLYKPE